MLLIESIAAFGLRQWLDSAGSGTPATAGTVMLAALPVILGAQMLLSWLNFDVSAEPRQAIHPVLGDRETPFAGSDSG
ncbi:hypothetical protein [Marilutibacter alkalisoli]|uniref:Uncharacterized protein n=1 Tax=Marilutibacter alkalisoli TaxID=2591633 RepID=A0A514BNP7_9GAMM|nr:hypothetical protein [Lysobacter alkalisoli]QDH69018.1 hypothetical protein FKV23_02040 [Lysobacter alkalisoli]